MNSKGSALSYGDLLGLKTVIRTKDFEESKSFYTQILNLTIVEEYNDGKGSRGCIMRFGQENSNAFFEISEITEDHYYYQESFSRNIDNDKTDIQIRTDNIEYWVTRLKEKWEARGPIDRPWGSKYLYLRDPDGLHIIIYQEKMNATISNDNQGFNMKNTSNFKKEYINSTPGYTNVVSIKNGNVKTLYIAGQVGSGKTMEEQIRSAYQGLIGQLKAADAEFSHVVKITSYIVNYHQEDLALFKKVRLEMFGDQVMPAITMVGVSALAFDNMKVEMEAVAVIPIEK